MKYLEISLVILATLFIHQNEAKPSTVLNNFEKNINDRLEFLKHYKTDLAVDGDKKFNDLLSKEEEKISSIIEGTLKIIQRKVEAADVEGHNAEKCSKSAQSYLDDVRSKFLSTLKKCSDNNKPDWSYFYEEIETQIQTGEKILNRFTGIREECSFKVSSKEVCIALLLPEAASLVGVHKAAVEKVKAAVQVATVRGFANVGYCEASPLVTFATEVGNAVKTAFECIKFADFDENMSVV